MLTQVAERIHYLSALEGTKSANEVREVCIYTAFVMYTCALLFAYGVYWSIVE